MRGGKGGKRELDARARLIHMFVQVGFNNAVIINAEAFADGILSDLQASIKVTPQ